MSDRIQIPVADLESIAKNLGTVKGELEAVEGGATLVDGLDPQHGEATVGQSVQSFHSEWKTSRKSLMDAIGKLGETSHSIATAATKVDDAMAGAYRNAAGRIGSVDYRGVIDAH